MKNKWHVVVRLKNGFEDSVYVHQTPKDSIEPTIREFYGDKLDEIILIERL